MKISQSARFGGASIYKPFSGAAAADLTLLWSVHIIQSVPETVLISSKSILDVTFNFRRPHLVIHQGLGQDVAELHGVVLDPLEPHPHAIAHRPYPCHTNVLQSSAKLQPENRNRESGIMSGIISGRLCIESCLASYNHQAQVKVQKNKLDSWIFY